MIYGSNISKTDGEEENGQFENMDMDMKVED